MPVFLEALCCTYGYGYCCFPVRNYRQNHGCLAQRKCDAESCAAPRRGEQCSPFRYGFVSSSRSGNRNNRIRDCVNAPQKKALLKKCGTSRTQQLFTIHYSSFIIHWGGHRPPLFLPSPAPCRERIYPFRFVTSTDAVNTTVRSRGFVIAFPCVA